MHVKELLSLKGKTILVTGGAGKYGRCIVEGLAEADGTVIAASRNIKACQETAKEFRNKQLDVHALQVDQGDHESILKLKAEIKEKYGKLHVFVNCAVARPMQSYDAPIEQLSESMRVNSTGMIDIVREMADLIADSGGGSIVNISSMMGIYGPDLSNYEGTDMGNHMPPDYFFHKGGMITLTRYLARMFAGKNIRVNAISPGGIFADQPERFIENYVKKVPVGRMANNDDVKGLVVFLASEASAYVNGENILMDGGMHA